MSTQSNTGDGKAFISVRHRNPEEVLAEEAAGKTDVIGAVCAIVATVLMLVTAVVLYMNWDVIKTV
jgi:hypothetical protein